MSCGRCEALVGHFEDCPVWDEPPPERPVPQIRPAPAGHCAQGLTSSHRPTASVKCTQCGGDALPYYAAINHQHWTPVNIRETGWICITSNLMVWIP